MTEPNPDAPLPAPEPARHGRGAAFLLAAALALVVGLLALVPFWAPPVTALLPWGMPAPVASDDGLAGRLDRLEAARAAEARAAGAAVAAQAAALDRVAQRIAALEAKPAPPQPPDFGEIQRQLARLAAAAAELSTRLDAVEKSAEKAAQAPPANDPTDAALALTLLQIRTAIEAGRPFAAEYDAFATLARARPELAAAAASLAEPARTGVATRAVLARRLRELAGHIATAEPPPGDDDWGGQIIARLRSLVTIRRIDGPQQTEPEAAVSAAELALGRGDLAGAVAALEPLSGANADAARPWLAMAATRLRVEAALQRVEVLLTARLGGPATNPATHR